MTFRLPPAVKLSRLAVVLALAATAGAQAADKKVAHVVQDPHYGDTLFHFYQEKYFTAVTTLMVSQHFERMPKHADEAEVLRGGLLLSYGMHREAGEIFSQLIEKGAEPKVRDRAWFFLAKIRYQRGLLGEAEEAVNRIEKNLPPELEEERVLLKANILMAKGDYAGAAAVLNAVPGVEKEISEGTPSASLYARYNLGVALIRNGELEKGSALLDQIGKAPTPPVATEEFRALRDRANVALGLSALQADKPEAAGPYLERVRLVGPQSNKALLGFGWSYASVKDHKRALVPWTELSARDPSDSAVLEANIAVPYSYGQLGAYSQALERFNAALEVFEREDKGLDESIAAIRAGKLVNGLLDRNPGEEMGWFWNIDQLPDMPHAGHLTQVLAQHDFQEAFKNYRDLLFLGRNLAEWKEKLGVFTDMLDNRRKAYADRLPGILAKARDAGAEAQAQRSAALKDELAKAESDADGVAFADEKERELLERLENVQATLKDAGNDPEMANARERARLARGAMVWRLAQAYPGRLYETQRALQTLEAGLAEVRQHQAALETAQREEPAKFDRFAARIAELDQRLQALIPRIADLSQAQQAELQELAVAQLNRQKERLVAYSTQARFAVAQLYDRATRATKEAENAAPK
jgi:TolA-binding protein